MVTDKHTSTNGTPTTPPSAVGVREAVAVPRGMNPEQGVLGDLMGFGPAPTRSRELGAIAINVLIVGVIFAVVVTSLAGETPIAFPAAVAIGMLAIFFGRRWIIGRRYWNAAQR